MYDSKFGKFDVSKVTYKVFNTQPIHAYVLIPKTLPVGAKAPLLVNFHGGFYVTGAAMDPGWFPQWLLDYCLLHSAIIVSAEYRMMPESNGLDILEDITDFWAWLLKDLNSHLETVKASVSGDLDKIIVQGGSAGGYLTIQDYLKAMKPGTIVTSAFPPARLDIALSISQQGLKKQFFGTDDALFPFKILEKKDHLPYTLILHGTEDSVVWLSGSEQFAEAVRNKFGEKKINLVTQPGEHGFDDQITLDMLWLQEALSPVTKLWLGEKSV